MKLVKPISKELADSMQEIIEQLTPVEQVKVEKSEKQKQAR